MFRFNSIVFIPMEKKNGTDKLIKNWEKDIEILNLVYKTLKVIAKIIITIGIIISIFFTTRLNDILQLLIGLISKK